MNKRVFTVLAALCFAASNAHATTLYGVPSCGSWVEGRSAEGWPQVVNKFWLNGYVSGIALDSGIDFLKNTDNNSVFLWVDNYCKANPLSDLHEAGYWLVVELKKRNKQ